MFVEDDIAMYEKPAIIAPSRAADTGQDREGAEVWFGTRLLFWKHGPILGFAECNSLFWKSLYNSDFYTESLAVGTF